MNPIHVLRQHLETQGKLDPSGEYLLRAIKQFLNEAKTGQKGKSVAIADNDTGDLARIIDHTALKPEVDSAQIKKLCSEATEYHFASVCVNPCYVGLSVELTAGSDVAVSSVVGFPLGATLTPAKVEEAKLVVQAGAKEVDMVLNVGMLKDQDYDYVERDIRAVVMAVHTYSIYPNPIVKVILETAVLTDEEKIIACVLATNAGVDFVKTSTGFARAGATVEDVALMRSIVGDRLGVKAAGGIRSYDDAVNMVRHGANRLGTSASVVIIEGRIGKATY